MQSIRKQVLTGARVRPMDAGCSVAEALCIMGDRIIHVGTESEALAVAGPDAEVVNLRGAAVFPGFIDTHSHLSMYSVWSDHVYCGAEAKTLAGVLERLRRRAASLKPGKLVLGWGFDDTILPEGRGPTLEELNAVAPRNPVIVVHISAHASYVNSKALQLAGLGPDTRIQGGEVVLNLRGEPTGHLLEMASFKAMGVLCPGPTPELLRGALRKGIADYNAQGFTATHDAGVGLGGIDMPMYLRCLAEMERDNALNMRIYLSPMADECDRYADLGLITGFGSDMVTFSGPKFFNDGSIQAYTAALSEPYYDRPDCRPGLLTPVDEMTELLVRRHCEGSQITYHGNGDIGIEVMIAAIEKAQRICPRPDPRHILVHCQTVSDAQLARMHKVGILPTFFGLHVWYYGDRHYERFLGPERAERIDPSGSAVRLGMRHSLHADSPVLPPWSLRSIHTAVTRTTMKGRVLGEDQRIGVEEAVRAYTSHAAYFHFAENRRGTLEPGKTADLVVLSKDLLTVPTEEILETEVLATMVGGRIVHGGFPAA